MKGFIMSLAVAVVQLFISLPAQANFLIDGGFVYDLKVMMEGNLGSELAIKTLDADPVPWVHLGKNYCELRSQGMSQSDILDIEWVKNQELESSEMKQAFWLLDKTVARVAKPTYCPEFS